MPMAKILVVEDDKYLALTINDCLSNAHHVVELAEDGVTARTLLSVSAYDLIVMDWNLPDMTGLEICREVRMSGSKTPVLFLTVKSNLTEKETAFDAGTDDYLTKPFHMRELAMRVKALLRRPPVLNQEKLTIKDLILDVGNHTVLKNGNVLKMFPKDFALLEFLMRHPRRLFTANELLESVWRSDSAASVDTVRQSLMRIRKQLGEGEQTVTITNIHGVGYRLDS